MTECINSIYDWKEFSCICVTQKRFKTAARSTVKIYNPGACLDIVCDTVFASDTNQSHAGTCNSATAQCDCHPGWVGIGCETADCPGEPDCNGRGTCDGENYVPPRCVRCEVGWMGDGCEKLCVHGRQEPPDSGTCTCDAVGCLERVQCTFDCTRPVATRDIRGRCPPIFCVPRILCLIKNVF